MSGKKYIYILFFIWKIENFWLAKIDIFNKNIKKIIDLSFYYIYMPVKDTILLIFLWILLLLLIIITIYYFFNAIRLIFSTTKKAPYIPSFDRQLEIMKQLKLNKNAIMVDLGCGDGKALRFFSKEHNIKLWEWFDINPYTVLKGRFLNRHQGITNVNLYKKDLFKVDLQKYDYIYVYLWVTQLAIMEDWIWETKKKDAVIISNSFKFKKHEPFKAYKNDKWVDTIFLYK